MSTAAPATAPRTLSLEDVETTLNLIDDRFYAYGLSALLADGRPVLHRAHPRRPAAAPGAR